MSFVALRAAHFSRTGAGLQLDDVPISQPRGREGA